MTAAAQRLPAAPAPRPSTMDALAAALAVARIEAERAYEATQSLSERQRLAPLIACYRVALERFHRDAPATRATHTDEGEPLGRVIEELYEAIPNSAVRTQKLADALSKARSWYYRPRFRFLADDGTGAAVFTECDTGERHLIPRGPAAALAREMWSPRARGDANALGEGIGANWEDDVAELFAA